MSKAVVVVVMFRYWVGYRDLEYGHAEYKALICALYVLINSQYASNMHLVNSE